MRITRRNLMLVAPTLMLPPADAQAGTDGLVVIVHRTSDIVYLSRDELEAIFTTRRKHWSGSTKIVVFNLPPKTTERTLFDGVVLRFNPTQVGQYWIDRKVRGGAPPPRNVPEPKLLLNVVAHTPNSIGYVPASLATSDVRIIARVRNGQVAAARSESLFDLGEFL